MVCTERNLRLGLGILRKALFHSPDLLRLGTGSYSLSILCLIQLCNSLRAVVFVPFGKDKPLSHHHITGRKVDITTMVVFKGSRMTREITANKSGCSLSSAEAGL